MELIGKLLRLLGDASDVSEVETFIGPILKKMCSRAGVVADDESNDEVILTIMCNDRVYEARLSVDTVSTIRFKEIWRAPDTYAYLFDEDDVYEEE